MDKKLIKIIFVVILMFTFVYTTINFVYASGVHSEEDTLPEPGTPDKPTPKPKPEPTPEPTPDPTPEPTPDPIPTPGVPGVEPEPPTYSISGNVWDDTTPNGILDQDEVLIDGITVNLYSNDSNSPITTVTTSSGAYSFSDLQSGNYKVEFEYGTSNYNGLNYKSYKNMGDENLFINNTYYATDLPSKRLELMEKFNTINNLLNLANTSMIATSEVEVSNGNLTVSLPIVKRPKLSVEVTKKVSHLTIILSDGSTLIDWDSSNITTVEHLMHIPNHSLTAIMDDELTHGATIKIQYAITVKNTGENDTLGNYFNVNNLEVRNIFKQFINNSTNTAYKNLISSINSNDPVPTEFIIYDYIDNNSIFDETNNPNNWKILNTSTNTISFNDNNKSSQTILYNSVSLMPGQTQTFTLNTSKVMTITDADLLTYDNYVEVVQYTNILGKIMEGSTPGNLDITNTDRQLESDEAKAETVSRVPPFGKDLSYYGTLVGIIILAIEIVVLSVLKYKIKSMKKSYFIR